MQTRILAWSLRQFIQSHPIYPTLFADPVKVMP